MTEAPFLDEFHGSKRITSTTTGPSDPDYRSFLTRITECRRVPVVSPHQLLTIMSASPSSPNTSIALKAMAERADTKAIIECVKHVQTRRQSRKPRLTAAISEVLHEK